VAVEPELDAKGQRHVWLAPDVVNRLANNGAGLLNELFAESCGNNFRSFVPLAALRPALRRCRRLRERNRLGHRQLALGDVAASGAARENEAPERGLILELNLLIARLNASNPALAARAGRYSDVIIRIAAQTA
jgi:hypothetical protein